MQLSHERASPVKIKPQDNFCYVTSTLCLSSFTFSHLVYILFNHSLITNTRFDDSFQTFGTVSRGAYILPYPPDFQAYVLACFKQQALGLVTTILNILFSNVSCVCVWQRGNEPSGKRQFLWYSLTPACLLMARLA